MWNDNRRFIFDFVTCMPLANVQVLGQALDAYTVACTDGKASTAAQQGVCYDCGRFIFLLLSGSIGRDKNLWIIFNGQGISLEHVNIELCHAIQIKINDDVGLSCINKNEQRNILHSSRGNLRCDLS